MKFTLNDDRAEAKCIDSIKWQYNTTSVSTRQTIRRIKEFCFCVWRGVWSERTSVRAQERHFLEKGIRPHFDNYNSIQFTQTRTAYTGVVYCTSTYVWSMKFGVQLEQWTSLKRIYLFNVTQWLAVAAAAAAADGFRINTTSSNHRNRWRRMPNGMDKSIWATH